MNKTFWFSVLEKPMQPYRPEALSDVSQRVAQLISEDEGEDEGESIKELGLSTALTNLLLRYHINSVEKLVTLSGEDLLSCRGLGQTSLMHITNALALRGLKLLD